MDFTPHMRRILVRLGEDALWTRFSGGTPTAVRGMFLAPFQSANLGDVAIVGTSDPQFACMNADVPAAARGDTLVYPVAGATYKVRNAEPDPVSGLVVLQLEA